jgi:hypothetical protein
MAATLSAEYLLDFAVQFVVQFPAFCLNEHWLGKQTSSGCEAFHARLD